MLSFAGDADQGVKMQIIFKRRLTNEVLTTYLPTVLLMGIVYATTYFKQFFFEAALTVNLTVMLVVTTLFISVMEKLPPTSYIRMVDIWHPAVTLGSSICILLRSSLSSVSEENVKLSLCNLAHKATEHTKFLLAFSY